MKKPLKVAFLTSSDPTDRTSWSGIYSKMFEGLTAEFEVVDALGPQENFFLKGLGGLNFLSKKLFRKQYNHKHSILRSKMLARLFKKKLSQRDYDIIFAPAASTEVAFLQTDIPIIYLSDSSFGQLNNYYSIFTNLLDISVKESNYIEQRGIRNSSGYIYSSQWAADFVVKNYGVQKEKIKIIPFGANIEEKYIPNLSVKTWSGETSFKLLFVGVDWIRKGGEIAFEAFEKLLSNGYDVELIVCGCEPPYKHNKMTVYPFLNKNIESDLLQLTTIYQNSHLMFVPTRADCSPIIFCEAAAFGLPVLTTDTGGVNDLIENGQNGYCLEYSTGGLEYAKQIENIISDHQLYASLSSCARSRYEQELNWKSWASITADFFHNVLKNKE